MLQQQALLQSENQALKRDVYSHRESIGQLSGRLDVAEASNSLYFDAFRYIGI